MSDPSHAWTILPELADWGLFGLALCSAAEKLVSVIPSAGMLLMLGMVSVARPGDLPCAIAITAAGSTTGSLFWYAMGRWLGPIRGDAIVQTMSRRLAIREEWYLHLKHGYCRNLIWVTFFGQLIPVARAYMAFPAGVLAIPALGFAVATFCGAALWNAPFLLSGYLLRKQMLAADTATPAAVAAIVLVNILLFALFRLCRPGRYAA